MIVLHELQYPEVLRQLRLDRPRSLQIEAQMRNHLYKTYAWPGTEFVVDQLPNFSVIWSRPIEGCKEYVPRSHGAAICLYAKTSQALAAVSQEPDFVDWRNSLVFGGVERRAVSDILMERCREHGELVEDKRDYVVLVLEPDTMSHTELPDGYQLGTLSPEHAVQVNAEWPYGGPESLPYFEFIIGNHHPNVAVYETSTSQLAAYILYSGDGSLGSGFVGAEHRRKGLFQIVCREAAKKVRAMGQEVVWFIVDGRNQASLDAFVKMGAKLLSWKIDWLNYSPMND